MRNIERLPKDTGDKGNIYISPRLNKLLNHAVHEAEKLKDEYVSVEHIMIAMAEESTEFSKTLNGFGITRDSIYRAMKDIRGSQRVTDQNPEGKYQALSKYGRNLNEIARRGKLDPV